MKSLKPTLVGFVLGVITVAGIDFVNAEKLEKPAFLVVSGVTLNADAMEPYYEVARPLAATAGIEFLARADSVDASAVLEGEWNHPGFLIVEKFSSMQALKDFWFSDDYQAAIALREPGVKMNFIVALEGD